MIHGKMMSRIAKPVPCPKLAAMSRAMKTQSTKAPMIRRNPSKGIQENSVQPRMAQKKYVGRFDIFTTLYSL